MAMCLAFVAKQKPCRHREHRIKSDFDGAVAGMNKDRDTRSERIPGVFDDEYVFKEVMPFCLFFERRIGLQARL